MKLLFENWRRFLKESERPGPGHTKSKYEQCPEKIAFDVNRCGHTYSSLSSYRWNHRTETQKPLHDWSSHCSDAIRYAVYSYQRTRVSVYA